MIEVGRLLPVVVAVVALAVLGIGTGAAEAARTVQVESRYQLEMRVPGRDVSASIAAISDVEAKALRYPLPPTAAIDAAAALTKVHGKLRDAARRLKGIRPPAAVAREHNLLVTGVGLLEAELPPIIAKLHKGQFTVVATLSSLPGGIDLNSALRGLRRKGYPIVAK